MKGHPVTLDSGDTVYFSGAGGTYTVLNRKSKIIERGKVQGGKAVRSSPHATLPTAKVYEGLRLLYGDEVKQPKPKTMKRKAPSTAKTTTKATPDAHGERPYALKVSAEKKPKEPATDGFTDGTPVSD